MRSAKSQSVALRAKLFRGFSDPSRLSILSSLLDGPRAVNEIVEETGLAQSNVSNHLSCLSECGLVLCERDGRYRRYRLSDPQVGILLDLADDLLAEVARGVHVCVNYEPSHVPEHGAPDSTRPAARGLNGGGSRGNEPRPVDVLEGAPSGH